jgi:hypothetical protein
VASGRSRARDPLQEEEHLIIIVVVIIIIIVIEEALWYLTRCMFLHEVHA